MHALTTMASIAQRSISVSPSIHLEERESTENSNEKSSPHNHSSRTIGVLGRA
jgi:hypothetical protein